MNKYKTTCTGNRGMIPVQVVWGKITHEEYTQGGNASSFSDNLWLAEMQQQTRLQLVPE